MPPGGWRLTLAFAHCLQPVGRRQEDVRSRQDRRQEEVAMSNPCGGIDGCWHTGQVAVGYFPYVVIVRRTEVRVAPAMGGPVVFPMKKPQRLGGQSKRTPDELATPAQRPARGGFRWGYGNEDGASGWIPADAIRPDHSDEVWADGPAGADFQVG